MTVNQRRAIELAQGVVEGRVRIHNISDEDWSLLLLASGMAGARTIPAVVCLAVLDNAARADGYFSPARPLLSTPVDDVPGALLSGAAGQA